MQLAELIEIGAVSSHLQRVTITWNKPNLERREKDGKTQVVAKKPTPYTFDVHVVTDLSYGASERILRAQALNEQAVGARVVAEAIRFGESGTERISYEKACEMDPSLIWELRKAFVSVNPNIINEEQANADDAKGEEAAAETKN